MRTSAPPFTTKTTQTWMIWRRVLSSFRLTCVGLCCLLSRYLQLNQKEAPDMECRDSVGNTPLHCAAYRGHKQCIIKLLKSGANPSNQNNTGKAPVAVYGSKCVVVFVVVDRCPAGQTAADLVRSEELRLILAAYRNKVRTCDTSAGLFVTLSYLSCHGNSKIRISTKH